MTCHCPIGEGVKASVKGGGSRDVVKGDVNPLVGDENWKVEDDDDNGGGPEGSLIVSEDDGGGGGGPEGSFVIAFIACLNEGGGRPLGSLVDVDDFERKLVSWMLGEAAKGLNVDIVSCELEIGIC